MRALAAGRGAGVEHALARLQIQQAGRALRARSPAPIPRRRRIPGRRSTGTGFSSSSASAPMRRAAIPSAARRAAYASAVDAARVHAQAHRRMHVARGEHLLPRRRIGRAYALDPPGRVLMMRDGVGGQPRIERRPRAQEAAQQRIHIALRARALHRSAGPRRLVDHGVIGVAPRFERVERAPQQRLDQRIGGAGAARQRRDDGLRAAIAAQRAVAQVGQRAARGGRRVRPVLGGALQFRRQAAAGRDARDQRGRRSERLSERRQGGRRLESGKPRRKSAAPRRVPPARCSSVTSSASFAAGDLHAARAGFQHRARACRCPAAQCARQIFDRLAAQLRARAGDRAQRADLALDFRMRPRPVDLGVLLADLARIAGAGFGLRHRAARARRRCRRARARWRARRARRACRAGIARRRPRAIASGCRESSGPVSSPASICMIVIPVSRSPASSARWIGAAPRQRGSSEAWMLSAPCGATSSARGGRINP